MKKCKNFLSGLSLVNYFFLIIFVVQQVSAEQGAAQQNIKTFKGPQTIDLPEDKIGIQGNWVKKKQWIKSIKEVNDEISLTVANIQKLRKDFDDRFRAIEKELDDFYKQEGFTQGKLKEIFAGIEKYLEKKKKKEVDEFQQAGVNQGITSENRVKIEIIEEDIKAKKRDLEQLKLDITAVEELQKSVIERLKKLDEQIAFSLDISSKSEKLCEEIYYIIDDKKVRAIYYDLKGGNLEKVKAVQNYIQNDLSTDLDKVLGVIRSQVSKVKDGVKAIEEKGFIFKNRAERVEKIKLEELEKSKEEQDLLKAKKEKELALKKASNIPWYEKVYNFFMEIFKSILNFLKSLLGAGSKGEIKSRSVETKVTTTLDKNSKSL